MRVWIVSWCHGEWSTKSVVDVKFEYFFVKRSLAKNAGRQQKLYGADTILNGELECEVCRTNNLHQLASNTKRE
jgi:hypothetical protein